MSHSVLFAFEDDFVATLRCIPMAVRFKLDLVGVKLSLRQWSRFTQDDRSDLLTTPCASPSEIEAYRCRLVALLADRLQQEPAPLPANSTVGWEDVARTPQQVRAFAETMAVRAPADGDWNALTPLQRFTLLKLSRDSHDNINFVPALAEFGLVRDNLASTWRHHAQNA